MIISIVLKLDLIDHQQGKVRNMLREENAVVSVDNSDTVEVNSNFMNVALNTQVPIRQSYNSIHRPLCKELNKYIKKQWRRSNGLAILNDHIPHQLMHSRRKMGR